MGLGVLGEKDDSRRPDVEAVQEEGGPLRIEPRRLQQPVDGLPVAASRRGQREPRRFFEGEEALVLEKNHFWTRTTDRTGGHAAEAFLDISGRRPLTTRRASSSRRRMASTPRDSETGSVRRAR